MTMSHVRVGDYIRVRSKQPWHGRSYDLTGKVVSNVYRSRSGAVLRDILVEDGGIEDIGKGFRRMVGRKIAVPWSRNYIEVDAVVFTRS